MEILFLIIGIISIIYAAAIFIFNGLCPFLWFWPLFALSQFIIAVAIKYLKTAIKKRKKVKLKLFIYFFTSYALAIIIVLSTIVASHSRSLENKNDKNLDYVIVMGSILRDNGVSKSLKNRLDTAISYYEENPDTIFVLSGGKGKFQISTEATIMYNYMIKNNVPAENLILEFYSKSTMEKIGYSIDDIYRDREDKIRLMEKNRPISPCEDEKNLVDAEDKPIRIGIITESYNIYRSVEMAKKRGIKYVYPIEAKCDYFMLPHFAIREAIAIFKDKIIGNL